MNAENDPLVAPETSPPPAAHQRSTVHRVLRSLFTVFIVSPALLLIGLWSALAIHFPSISHQSFRTTLAWAFVIGFAAAFAFIRNRRRTTLCLLGAFAAVLVWWLTISPTHDRDWDDLAAVLPSATIDGDMVTIRNIRNFEYRSATDFTPHYYDRTFDLSKIRTLDFLICYWGSNEKTAHSMLSFGFSDGKYLCLSVEARPERGETYAPIGGMFKKHELIYVLGDELDLIRSRTHFRDERVYLYPTASPPADVHTMFLEIIKRVNEIKSQPEFYNTLTHNCTTSLAASGRTILPPNPFDIRLLLNGYADRMAYDNGWIATKDSFAETRKRHYVNQYVEGKPDTANFSELIRPHLVGR
jgi:hypothetical protein